jgi:8-amino-7-oxononanoate synthase
MSSRSLEVWLRGQAEDRASRGLHRELRPRTADEHVIDLAGNDYLGLSREPSVVAAAVAAVQTWGCGSTGSRLVTGTTDLHAALDRELARFAGSDAALVFATGYAANLGVLTALADDETLIVSDVGNHASLIDGCRLSRGHVVVTAHRDVAAVERALAQRSRPRALVVTDAVFSVDGEAAPIAALYDVCRRQQATLVVDEAHSFGVVGPDGRGVVAQAGLAGRPDVVRTVTMSKALGAQGGAVLATPEIVAHLVDSARTFIFDTGLAPASAGGALQALRVLQSRPALAAAARYNAGLLAAALGLPAPVAAIVAVPIADPLLAVETARRCADAGVRVGCFRPPSVPDAMSRLRMSVRADLSADEVARAAAVVASSLELEQAV